MDLGFAVPVSGSWATPANQRQLARRAEDLGYASLWTFQRLLYPAGGTPLPMVYRSVLDPIVSLSYLAGLTERIRLGLAIVNAPFYSPAVLAKQLATLDQLSDGRLDAGLGLGWSAAEFAAAGVPMTNRGRRVEEFLACLEALWRDDPVEFHGEFYEVPRSHVDPKPKQQPRPPVLFGGFAEPALRRAGRIADGWISGSTADLTTIGTSISAVQRAAVEAGRDPAALRFVVRGVVRLRPAGGTDRRALSGSIAEVRGDLHALAEAGATEVFLDLNFDEQIGSPDADPATSVHLAMEVLEAFAPDTDDPSALA